MKRLLLAGLLVLPFALSRTGARAEPDDAYGSLVGMADSAVGDKGPEAGDIPPAAAAAEGRRASGAPSGEPPITEYGSARIEKAGDATAVAVPATMAPRVWTRLFASLLPSMTRVSSFEVAVSTTARRVRPVPERMDTAASVAGAAQGLLELVAATTSPTVPDR